MTERRGMCTAGAAWLLWAAAGCAGEANARGEAEAVRASGPVPVEIASEGVTLSGFLWLPDGPGPHPAAVYVHGSGRVRRSAAGGPARRLNEVGIALLAYDKRGVGESGGVYEGRNNASAENLELLARDAAAALAFLRGRPEIDPEQVGLWGVSQAGWIVPIAATLDGGVAFTILRSGPTVTVGEETVYSRLTGDDSATRDTLSAEEISRLLAERGPYGFDPRPWLERMEAPGLWLLGDADESIPIPETVAILDELIADHGRDFRYRVWPGADHALRVSGRPVPELWPEQIAFLFDHVGVRVR